MAWATLGLGSNDEPEANLASGLDELLLQFRDLALSNVYRSTSSDRAGPDYLNMAVGINTDLPLQELVAALKKIEDKHGRDRSKGGTQPVSLDIDLLTYGDKAGTFSGITLPRPEITTAAHVLWPLAQIAPRHKHPVLKRSFGELWQAFDKSAQALIPVHFVWHDRVISKAAK